METFYGGRCTQRHGGGGILRCRMSKRKMKRKKKRRRTRNFKTNLLDGFGPLIEHTTSRRARRAPLSPIESPRTTGAEGGGPHPHGFVRFLLGVTAVAFAQSLAVPHMWMPTHLYFIHIHGFRGRLHSVHLQAQRQNKILRASPVSFGGNTIACRNLSLTKTKK